MLKAFGAYDTSLQPQSALLSAFQQRLQALDVPQSLSAVVSNGSWLPADIISSPATTLQLALPASVTGGSGSSIVRKRKGYSSPSDRGRPLRKSKAEGERKSDTCLLMQSGYRKGVLHCHQFCCNEGDPGMLKED